MVCQAVFLTNRAIRISNAFAEQRHISSAKHISSLTDGKAYRQKGNGRYIHFREIYSRKMNSIYFRHAKMIILKGTFSPFKIA